MQKQLRASHWIRDESLLTELVRDARMNATGIDVKDFTVKMQDQANQYGLHMYVSERQMKWLCGIAGWVFPPNHDPRADRHDD
jgi:hypothetical protein